MTTHRPLITRSQLHARLDADNKTMNRPHIKRPTTDVTETPAPPPWEFGTDRNDPGAFKKALKEARHRNQKRKRRYRAQTDEFD